MLKFVLIFNLNFKNIKTATFAYWGSNHPSLTPLLDPFNWYQSIYLHCFGLITIGGRRMSLQSGVLDVECLCLMESSIVLEKMSCLRFSMDIIWKSILLALVRFLLIPCILPPMSILTWLAILELLILSLEDCLEICLYACLHLNVLILYGDILRNDFQTVP